MCAVPSLGLALQPQMAVLEIQANGDTRVTEEAIARARHSLSDPNMRVSSLPHPLPPTPPEGLDWCAQCRAIEVP